MAEIIHIAVYFESTLYLFMKKKSIFTLNGFYSMNFWSRLQQSFSVTSKVLRESIKILRNFMNGCDDIFALYFI